ncbi:hypothetical protein [Solibacillus sp. CAU 1738]|uniref:hypothetical protein n=1 Tax=Solibacillus sp. CAU 1738 TaxID=3140363 RepID=UPI003261B9E1
MNSADAYDLCCKYHGQRVRITDRQGNTHVGHITRVTRRMVWLEPNNPGGYGLGWGWGRENDFERNGFGFGIAIGFIAGVALTSAFFW